MGVFRDALANYMNASADKQRAQQQQILMQQKQDAMYNQYYADYVAIANDIVLMLNKVQAKYQCLSWYDISVVCSAFPYHMNNTMSFCIPFAYALNEQDYEEVMHAIQKGLLRTLGNVYPDFRGVNVYEDNILSFRCTSYGFDLVSLRQPFY